jgi:hypothetical protein
MAVSNVNSTAPEAVGFGNFGELKTELFRDGFLSLNQVTDADDIRWIREVIIDLLTDRSMEAPKNLGDADTGGGAKILEIASPSALPRLAGRPAEGVVRPARERRRRPARLLPPRPLERPRQPRPMEGGPGAEGGVGLLRVPV